MAASRVDRSKKPYSRPVVRAGRADGEWLHDKAPGTVTARENGIPTAPSTSPNTKLLISNLHYEVTARDLTQIFGQMGTLVREPHIRYDRSGRSSGIAIVSYETVSEAKKAMNHFNGKLCKGQPMSIVFDSVPQRPQARRSASAPSLLNRIQKPPLLDRLGQTGSRSKSPPASRNGPGPIRNKGRSARGGRAPREPKKPKTAEELDMELDTFMKDDVKAPTSKEAEGDVEMAA